MQEVPLDDDSSSFMDDNRVRVVGPEESNQEQYELEGIDLYVEKKSSGLSKGGNYTF